MTTGAIIVAVVISVCNLTSVVFSVLTIREHRRLRRVRGGR